MNFPKRPLELYTHSSDESIPIRRRIWGVYDRAQSKLRNRRFARGNDKIRMPATHVRRDRLRKMRMSLKACSNDFSRFPGPFRRNKVTTRSRLVDRQNGLTVPP